jgi:hypothetical protein
MIQKGIGVFTALTLLSALAGSAPNELFGKSIAVGWAESITETFASEQVTRIFGSSYQIYADVSTTGGPFVRMAQSSIALPAPKAEALKDATANIEMTISVLKSINSVDDARAAKSQLRVLRQRGIDLQARMMALVGKQTIESPEYAKEKLEENQAALRELFEEGSRLMHRNREAWEVIAPTLKGLPDN